jgi:four helix bundle protein
VQDFRQLKVWQKSHRLTVDVYQATAEFPREEVYGLTNQMRRSCVSIPSNIAEGCGRGSDQDLRRFLQIAMGSASELEYQLLLANELGFVPASNHEALQENVGEVKRMLASFILRLRADS